MTSVELRREKIEAAFQRRFSGVTRVLQSEVDEWQAEIFERVHARMRAMPNLTADAAALIVKGETEAAGELLATEFERCFNEELLAS